VPPQRRATPGQLAAIEAERRSAERRIANIRCRARAQREDALRADAAGRDDWAARHRMNADDLEAEIPTIEAELNEFERRVSADVLPPDPTSVETLRHAEALKRQNLRTARRRGDARARYLRRSLAQTRRRRRGAQLGAAVRRTPRARPASRSRVARRSRSTSRAGPGDDDPGEPEPPRPGRLTSTAEAGR